LLRPVGVVRRDVERIGQDFRACARDVRRVPQGSDRGVAPAVLRWWKTAKVDSHTTVQGFLCSKENDGKGHSGSSGCIPTGRGYPKLSNFELIMTGRYTLAQIRALFGG